MDCIIQARMNSTRLPNKILMLIKDKPILQHVIERISKATKIDHIIIATTVNKCDDPIVELCQKLNILYYRGNEQDVLDRYYKCAIKYKSKNIMRVTSDCPLIDPKVIDNMIDIYYTNSYDTLMPSYYGEETGAKGGFPDGCNPEIVSFKLLQTVWTTAKLQQEREHVTKYIYTHLSPNRYKISLKNQYPNIDLGTLHLSLDTKDDLQFLTTIYDKLYESNNLFTIEDVLRIVNNMEEIKIIPVNKTDEEGKLIMEWRNDKVTRINSFNQELKEWSTFKTVFCNKYFEHYIPPLFCVKNNKKIGFIGCIEGDKDNEYKISINLAPEERGKGYGKKIIKIIINYVKIGYPNVKSFIAEIKESNLPSIKLFEGSSFKYESSYNYKGVVVNRYSYNMNQFVINNREISLSNPTYIIAELSCNHNQDIKTAYKLIDAVYKSGADAVKLQTYTPDCMTIDSDQVSFTECLKGTIWEGETLYQLYSRAYTPWEWHKELKEYANKLGLDLFTSPFSPKAVDFLETVNIPAYKVASFEITDIPLLKRIAKTGKPVIISSGMASVDELSEAVKTLRKNGSDQIAILKCTSAYPSKPENANLITIKDMQKRFKTVVGLSDHTLGIEVPITAVALGARIIEKHFTLSRDSGSPDDAFSLTPDEFKHMVDSIRIVEKSLGGVKYGCSAESGSKMLRKSIFVIQDIKKGGMLTEENIKVIRPNYGLHSREYENIVDVKRAKRDLKRGEPLAWDMLY